MIGSLTTAIVTSRSQIDDWQKCYHIVEKLSSEPSSQTMLQQDTISSNAATNITITLRDQDAIHKPNCVCCIVEKHVRRAEALRTQE